jgi:hypothetical protein
MDIRQFSPGELAQGLPAYDGYRVSAETATDDAGVPYNTSVTIHANSDRDRITMSADGSVDVIDAGEPFELVENTGGMLSGGEEVYEDYDGSVTVTDTRKDWVSTTLRANGHGVDAKTQTGPSEIEGLVGVRIIA